MGKYTFDTWSGGIGGSSYIHNKEIGIDFGAIHDGKRIRYPQVPLCELPVFILSHDHLDHCGGLPLFLNEHFESRFLATNTAFAGAQLQLRDSVKIAKIEKDIALLEGRNPDPLLFNSSDINRIEDRFEPVINTSWFEPLKRHKMSFRSAGHKPGAAMILIVFPDGTRVVHACDISLDEQALVGGASLPQDFLNPDVLVVECTYGNRELPERKSEEARLIEIVRQVFARGGKIVIPHFASTLGNIALILAKAGLPAYVDGMGREFMRNYATAQPWCEQDKPFDLDEFSSLFFVGKDDPKKSWVDREALIQQSKPVAIVSSSGMLEGGPSVLYVQELLENPKNAVIIPGYQAEDTQGRKILQLQKGEKISFSQKKIKNGKNGKFIDSETVSKKILADVLRFQLSGHSGGDKMAEWATMLNPKKVITVHGDPDAHEGFRDRVLRLNKKIEVVGAKNGETIAFSF